MTDIYPTLCDAAGIDIPNPDAIDGISFWPQVLGAGGEPRQFIYTWYNGNNPATDLSRTLRYAFNKEFKRYAPHANYPQGRFFDLRSDPMELAGDRKVKVAWVHYHHSGLEPDQLDPLQRAAYVQLGRVIDAHRYVPVAGLKIRAPRTVLAVGDRVELVCEIRPANATRRNVIWESSDPAVAAIDKFGTVTAHAPGSVTLTVYSWDDAAPMAAGRSVPAYRRTGIRDTLSVQVTP